LITCYYIENSLTAEALLAQQIWQGKYIKHLSKGTALQKYVMGGFIPAQNEQFKSFISLYIFKKTALWMQGLKGKKVSKLYIYSIQLIMSEYEKN
jgi:hypothetical protein